MTKISQPIEVCGDLFLRYFNTESEEMRNEILYRLQMFYYISPRIPCFAGAVILNSGDAKRAKCHFEYASELDFIPANYGLASTYLIEDQTKISELAKKPKASIKWKKLIHSAANCGNSSAATDLSKFYWYKGDPYQAIYWAALADIYGSKDAGDFIKEKCLPNWPNPNEATGCTPQMKNAVNALPQHLMGFTTYETIRCLDAKDPLAAYILSAYYKREGNIAEQRQVLTQSCEANPGNGALHFAASEALLTPCKGQTKRDAADFYLSMAADLGSAQCYLKKGTTFEHDSSAPQNRNIAAFWYGISASLGCEEALAKIKTMAKTSTFTHLPAIVEFHESVDGCYCKQYYDACRD